MAYRFLLNQAQQLGKVMLFVEYEKLCDNSEVVWKALGRSAAVREVLPAGFVLSKAHTHGKLQADCETVNEAYKIHSELKIRFKKTLAVLCSD